MLVNPKGRPMHECTLFKFMKVNSWDFSVDVVFEIKVYAVIVESKYPEDYLKRSAECI